MDDLGPLVVGQLVKPTGAVLARRFVASEDDRSCRRRGAQVLMRDSAITPLAHEPFG